MKKILEKKSRLVALIVSVCAVLALTIAGIAYAASLNVIERSPSDIDSGNNIDFVAGVALYRIPTVDNCETPQSGGSFTWNPNATSRPSGAFVVPAVAGRHTYYGPGTVRWNNLGIDADGDNFDLVLTLDWMDVTLYDDWGLTNVYGMDADPVWGWCISAFPHCRVHKAQLTYRFYKHGTSNRARGVFINGYKDIDVPNDPEESIQIVSGLASNTVYVGSGWRDHMTIDAANAKFVATNPDDETWNSGFLAAFDTSQDITIYWTGEGCGTELFKTYLQHNVTLKENMDVGYMGATSTAPVANQGVYSSTSGNVVKIPFNNTSVYKAVVENLHYHIASITGADTNYYNGETNRITRNNVHERSVSLGKLSTDRTVTVNFEPDVYELTFNMQGHGTNPGSQLHVYTEKPTKPADPTAAHCIFLGWYNEPACTTPFDFNHGMDADDVAYAKWVELGNFEFDKLDNDFSSTNPQGNGTLANATFNVINNNGRTVYVKTNGTGAYTTVANGGVCFQVKTDANGHFTSAADALEKGNYILREVTPPTGYQSIGDVAFSVPWAGA